MRALSVVDYDSLDALLSDTRDDPARALEGTEDIRRVCLYACSRKETSKAASALILRFFYGYTPQATATLMRVSAGGVDQWLSIARAEARVFLREPRRVASIDDDAPRAGGESSETFAHEDLLVSLRRRILATRQGPCLSEVELARWDWMSAESESVDRERLAHVVSCRACLESVTARVGLPSPWELASRDEDDGGPKGGWGGGGRRRHGVTKSAGPRPSRCRNRAAASSSRASATIASHPGQRLRGRQPDRRERNHDAERCRSASASRWLRRGVRRRSRAAADDGDRCTADRRHRTADASPPRRRPCADGGGQLRGRRAAGVGDVRARGRGRSAR